MVTEKKNVLVRTTLIDFGTKHIVPFKADESSGVNAAIEILSRRP
jgi:hypothetical protein